jgi:hypothetical protein
MSISPFSLYPVPFVLPTDQDLVEFATSFQTTIVLDLHKLAHTFAESLDHLECVEPIYQSMLFLHLSSTFRKLKPFGCF